MSVPDAAVQSRFSDASTLVTGGAGFVGSNLVRQLLREGVNGVTIVDNFLSAEHANVPDDSRVRLIEGSAADDSVLGSLDPHGFDFVWHLSTYHGNQSSIHDPIADHANNLLPTLKVCEWLKGSRRLRKLVYSGAGCAVAEKTYDEACATSEEAPVALRMDSPYSISKIVGEFYLVYYHERHRLAGVRARFQNVYGPGEILGAGRWRGTPATVWRNVTPSFVWRALHGQSLPLEGGGETSRDFIFVEDVVEGLVRLALDGRPGDVYNLASGVETTIAELAEQINALTDNRAPLQRLPRRDWDRSGRRFGDPSKARRELGFNARVSMVEGLARTVAWTKENREMIARCIAQHDVHMRAVG